MLDAMDWTNIIMTLITSGAFTAIYLLGDRKTASVLENVSKTIDQWQGLLKEVKEELAAKTEEYKEGQRQFDAAIAAKDAKIDALYKEISYNRDERDKLSSKVAFLTAYRCKKIGWTQREPPFGSTMDKETNKYNKETNGYNK